MNDKNRRYLEAGQRCRQWIADNAGLIPIGSFFENKCTALTAAVGEIEDLAGQVESAVGGGLSATDLKGSERLDLTDVMQRVRDAARAADDDNPGTRDRYRYTTNLTHQGLLAAGRAFALGGMADKVLLVNYGAPDNWPDDCTAACDAFEASFGQQDSAQGDRIAANALLTDKINDMVRLKGTISHMIPNYCSGQVGAVAAWTSAAHIESPPKKPTPPTPPGP